MKTRICFIFGTNSDFTPIKKQLLDIFKVEILRLLPKYIHSEVLSYPNDMCLNSIRNT